MHASGFSLASRSSKPLFRHVAEYIRVSGWSTMFIKSEQSCHYDSSILIHLGNQATSCYHLPFAMVMNRIHQIHQDHGLFRFLFENYQPASYTLKSRISRQRQMKYQRFTAAGEEGKIWVYKTRHHLALIISII